MSAASVLHSPNHSKSAALAALSRGPAIKLANSHDHKEQLLRKLLNTPCSTDLQQQAATCKPTPPTSSLQSLQGSPLRPGKNDHTRSNPNIKESQPSIKAPSASARKKIHGVHDIHDHPINKLESLTRREIHIYSERQRRKGMTHLYSTLHSLLPAAKPKTDRCTVLTEAMDYIHILRGQVEELERQKTEILVSLGEHHNLDYGFGADGDAANYNSSLITEISDEVKEEVLLAADVAVRFCGRDAFVTLSSPKKKGVWPEILQILHEQDMELLNVTLSTSNDMDYHCIHARMSTASDLRSQELQKMLQDLVLSHAILD